jgi:integrase
MAKELTVGHHLERFYTEWQIQGRKSIDTARSHAKPIVERFGKVPAVTIKTDDLRTYIVQRKEAGKANATINRELAVLRRTLVLAYESGELDRVPKFPSLKEENIRQGTYTREEVDRVMTELPLHLQPVVLYAYLTGRRRGEILQLKWDDIDLKARVITVRQDTTKTGDVDRIPLQGELYKLLLDLWERRREGVPWVFSHNKEQIGDFNHTFASAASRAGLKGKLFHDLRRSMVTDAVEAGVDPSVVMKITGHKTLKTFIRYRIVKTEGIRTAMSTLEEYRKNK